ncbi:MAG: Ycf66 family protein [Cyanobacteria bacterium P01_H01_bin.130]
MLAKILAVLVGLSSVSFYGLAWTFPQLSRRYDVVWAGAGLFYALVLWVCAGQVTGAIALGQLVILVLLGTLAWQVLQLRNGTPGESPALAQGMGAIALAGAVRSRVTGLSLFKREEAIEEAAKAAKATDSPEVQTETKPTPAETKESKPTVKVAGKKAAEDKAAEAKTESKSQKKAPPKAATKPMPTGKGVYQRKKVRKFDQPTQSPGKTTGQPVYQRKKVRKFDEATIKPAQPASEKAAAKADAKPKTAPPKQTTPTPQTRPTAGDAVPLGVDIGENFWETAAIAPESLLIPDNAATSTLPALDDPWTTPEVAPESLQLGNVEVKAPERVIQGPTTDVQPEPAPEPTPEKRSPRRRKPAPMPQDSNWPDEGDSNWPDDDADSNWPDEQPARRTPKKRRKPRPSVPVVEAEVVERSPRSPIILDAELVQEDEP